MAHSSVKPSEGPCSKTKKLFCSTSNIPIPPGKNLLPVIRVNDVAAALEKVECPDKYPANGGVTKVGL